MKLGIDIPSIIYNDAKENRGYISVGKMEIAWKAIADGKPLEQEPESSGFMTIDEYIKRKENRTLDKIRTEISCNIIDDDTSGNTPAKLRADWVAANKAHMIDIAIIDKYKSESVTQ